MNTDSSAAAVMNYVSGKLTAGGTWKDANASPVFATPLTKKWKFEDQNGKAWEGKLVVEGVTNKNHEYIVNLSVLRQSK